MRQWSNYYELDQCKVNKETIMIDPEMRERVYWPITKLGEEKPILFIHDGSSNFNFILVQFLMYLGVSKKVPYRITPLNRVEQKLTERSLAHKNLKLHDWTTFNEQGISELIDYCLKTNRYMQVSIKDPYYKFVVEKLQGKAYCVPIALDYSSPLEDLFYG